MKFFSRYDRAVYFVRQADYRYEGQRRILIEGLTAEFTPRPGGGSIFDTERAAKVLRWSAEDRDLVESYLLNHEDFGASLNRFVDPDEDAAAAAKDAPKAVCIVIVPQENGEVSVCGKPAVKETWCAEHLAEMVEAEARVEDPRGTREPRRAREPEPPSVDVTEAPEPVGVE
jgi:hypothetical protein